MAIAISQYLNHNRFCDSPFTALCPIAQKYVGCQAGGAEGLGRNLASRWLENIRTFLLKGLTHLVLC